jgi:uncharacterized protein (DUF2249 family)
MTLTGTEAYEAIRAHHSQLSEQLNERVTAVAGAVAARQPHGAAVAGLIAYITAEVLPHAAAEETTIYPAAAAHADLAATVDAMTAEHKTLSAAAARLAGLSDGAVAAEQAERIAELFTSHAAKENDILLPALVRDENVDLGALLSEMHHHAEHASPDPDLDVRDFPPARRHAAIFEAYHALAPGAGFILVNDHDPKPLRYQFEAEHAGQFTWDSLEAGPLAWRIRIGRPLSA